MTTERDNSFKWYIGLLALGMIVVGGIEVTNTLTEDNREPDYLESRIIQKVDSLESVVDSLENEVSLRSEAMDYADAYNTTNRIALAISKKAIKYDIPVPIAFSLVFSESGFDTSAVSNMGAIGLAQVLPSTARYLRDTISRSDLFNPETNLDIGFMYLRRLIDREGGMYEALRAYVAGPGRSNQDQNIGHGYATTIINRVN